MVNEEKVDWGENRSEEKSWKRVENDSNLCRLWQGAIYTNHAKQRLNLVDEWVHSLTSPLTYSIPSHTPYIDRFSRKLLRTKEGCFEMCAIDGSIPKIPTDAFCSLRHSIIREPPRDVLELRLACSCALVVAQ
jgi:hypothetical protein